MTSIELKSQSIKALHAWVRVHNKFISPLGKDSFCICWEYDGADIVLYGRDAHTFFNISKVCAVIENLHLQSFAEICYTDNGKRLQLRVYE